MGSWKTPSFLWIATMTISILVEPTSNGFRATTGGPFDLTVEADTASEAMKAIQVKMEMRIADGAMIVEQPIPMGHSPVVLPNLCDNPLFEKWIVEVEKYREERELQDISSNE
jgi:hypothetical protein